MIIKLTAYCPNCDEEMGFNLETTNLGAKVDISNFEQVDFYCDRCNKKFFTGDIDLFSEDEI